MGYKLGDIIPIVSPEPYPAQNANKNGLSQGDLVVNLACADFKPGEVVMLTNDDGTGCPYFGRRTGEEVCASFRHFAPLSAFSPAKPTPKPTVESTLTVYSDGVRVNATTVEFGGKSWSREELANTVRRYQEILRRPIAVVPEAKVNKATPKTKTTKSKTNK